MNDGLKQLQEEGIRWVDANKSKRFSGVAKLLTDLYPDNAHFIYELLQNAEDARDKTRPNSKGASVVCFTLNTDSLEFEHDGEGLFNLANVESITGIGDSNKSDDPTSIGKFGVGFKAVFAYTNTPEIHSGDYHFKIHDLVVPEPVAPCQMGERATKFIFPFNHPKKLALQAVTEIAKGFQKLGDNTLLFLRHIQKIEYQLPQGGVGKLERIEQNDVLDGLIEIRTSHPSGKDTVTHWLRFEKDVEVTDDDGARKICRIAIAYSLIALEESTIDQPAWKIVPLKQGQVSIYFPAEKEKSDLRFHIHAPFASTVARDSVRDCEANVQLIKHISNLVVESIVSIREQGMLTVEFLAVLPNKSDPLTSFYQPIRNNIIRAFKEFLLTPTKSGGHAEATSLYRGPAKISEVISDDDLCCLTSFPTPLWAANPRQNNQREYLFLDSLAIKDWSWSELASAVSEVEDDELDNIENWISTKEDNWLMRFYALLGEAKNTHKVFIDVSKLRIVRVKTEQGYEQVIPKDAYFPSDDGIPASGINFVKTSVYRTGATESQKFFSESFLKQIGVMPFNEKAIIELRLAKYNQPTDQTKQLNFLDIINFITYWKKNTSDCQQQVESAMNLAT